MERPKEWPRDYVNLKCIVFTFYAALIYWFRPPLLYGTAVNLLAVTLYNRLYECRMHSVLFTLAASLIGTGLVYVLPPKNVWALAVMLYLPYLALAWYDYVANCRYRMNPTVFPLGRWVYLPFKPPSYKERFDNLDPVVLDNIRNFDKLFVTTGALALCAYGFVFWFQRNLHSN